MLSSIVYLIVSLVPLFLAAAVVAVIMHIFGEGEEERQTGVIYEED